MTAPFDPLYTLKVAAEMIPYPGVGALHDWLRRHPEFPSRIQHVGRAKRRMRLLLLSEVMQIRAMLVKENPRPHVESARRSRIQSPSGPTRPSQ